MGSHPYFLIGKLCRGAFSLILARSFWTGRDVSLAEVHGLHESQARSAARLTHIGRLVNVVSSNTCPPEELESGGLSTITLLILAC